MFVILPGIFNVLLFHHLAGVTLGIDFLNFKDGIINEIVVVVQYAASANCVILVVFGKRKSKVDLPKWSINGYVIVELIIRLNVFR